MGEECMDLPPGFRFHPTDEEIITHYLSQKVLNPGFTARALGEVDLNKCEPWHLPSKAKLGKEEWYFFCHRDRKYPTGMRTNRATEAGYWKATGKDKKIYRGEGVLVGMKKTLVFYKGRAPKGEKTNWVMHEYRLEGKLQYNNLTRTAKDEWVVCRVFHKNLSIRKSPVVGLVRMNSFSDDLDISFSMPTLMAPPCLNSNNRPAAPSSVNGEQGDVLRGNLATSAPMPSYFTMLGFEDPQEQHEGFLPNTYSNTNNEVNQFSMFLPQIPPQNPALLDCEGQLQGRAALDFDGQLCLTAHQIE